MGTYLATGIVQDITIVKSRITTRAKFSSIRIDHIVKSLGKQLNLDYYDYSEDEERYHWKIKPDMLKNGLDKFLSDQFQIMYPDGVCSNTQTVLDRIKKAKTPQEIMDIAAERSAYKFQIIDIRNPMSVLPDNDFEECVVVHYNVIAYSMDGKIIMECYNNILRYFEYNIRLQRTKYPIVDCVKVMITD